MIFPRNFPIAVYFTLAFFISGKPVMAVTGPENAPPQILGLILTWQQDPTTTMTIDWHTCPDADPSTVEYRKLGSDENWIRMAGDQHAFPFSERVIHRVELTGLSPDTEYQFRFSEF